MGYDHGSCSTLTLPTGLGEFIISMTIWIEVVDAENYVKRIKLNDNLSNIYELGGTLTGSETENFVTLAMPLYGFCPHYDTSV